MKTVTTFDVVAPPSRGDLLVALRLWRGSGHGDSLSLAELKSLLLSELGIGMSEAAAVSVVERIYGAHGESVTCEQLVNVLVPLSECCLFEELSDAEVGPMQVAWNALIEKQQSGSSGGSSGESVSTNGARRTIEPTTDMLRMAAAEVYGLWPNGTARKADEHDLRTMAERLKEANTTAVDLPTAFALFREQRTRSRFKPSGKTIEAVLTAFDSDNTGALALDKFGRIAAAFDASKADVDRVLKEAMMSLEQPGAVHTTYVHIGNAALALQQRSAEIEIKTTK